MVLELIKVLFYQYISGISSSMIISIISKSDIFQETPLNLKINFITFNFLLTH